MSINLLLTVYAGIAVFTAVWVFYYGVVLPPRPMLFAGREYGLLTGTSILIGLAWLLFVPGLVIASVQAAQPWFGGTRGWIDGTRAARVRV